MKKKVLISLGAATAVGLIIWLTGYDYRRKLGKLLISKKGI